jgi:hypothetical protein
MVSFLRAAAAATWSASTATRCGCEREFVIALRR